MKEGKRKLIARFRCGNEMRCSQFWKGKEEEVYRICKNTEESLEHVIRECETTRSRKETEEILGAGGEGLEEVKRIKGARKKREEEVET